jgi:hypothetical protein
MSFAVKFIIIILLIGMLISLSSALFYLVKTEEKPKRVFLSLALRITLALSTFILLIFAFAMGWLQPHGIA